MSANAYERGVTDCAEGIPHKAGQGDSYDEGYSMQYELEQRASNVTTR